MTNHIFWLASYPKSGNTLLRAILISLLFTDDGIFKFDYFKFIGQFEETERIKKNISLFKNILKENINEEILFKNLINLQTRESLRLEKDKSIFLKTHSGLFNVYGYPFTNKSMTMGMIYLVRDPRDVCISWSRHSGKNINESIKFMCNDHQGLQWNESYHEEFFSNQNRPISYLSSWDRHVKSWCLSNWSIPKKIIRFEDIVYNKKKIILELIDFFEKNYKFKITNKSKKINNIIKYTEFENFKNEENIKGFKESNKKLKFFSVGKKNQWDKKLTKKQILKIEEKFNVIMKKFNYKLVNKL